MKLTLRLRIVLMLVPMFLLLAAVGGAGITLLHRLSGRIDAILRENYRSVNYMYQLNEALERIDSSFSLALSGQQAQARMQFDTYWKLYEDSLAKEQSNITLPGEQELVLNLVKLTDQYRLRGRAFYDLPISGGERTTAYHNANGLFELFKRIKTLSKEIRDLNQRNMEAAGAEAHATAAYSVTMLAVGLASAGLIAIILAWWTTHTILHPIQALTHSARAISEGNLDQVMPVVSEDEIGQLAQAFNLMARHLREYRRSQLDQLLRAQRTSQATIDSFPDPVLVIDVEGRVEMANPAARRLLGVTPLQTGHAASGIWQAPESLRVPLADALLSRRDYLPESFDHTIILNTADGECALLPRILTIRDLNEDSLGAAVVLQNVTRLRLLDQVKNNLVATASHELKTPLTGVRLAIHLLLEEAVGTLNVKQTELLLDARDNSERLLAVVNNLLDLGRLEQGWRQLDVRPWSVRTLLQSAGDAVQARAQDKDIEVVVDVTDGIPEVAADAVRIDHALRNLLDNALVYTDRGGRIILSGRVDGDAVVLAVTDTGCGIPAEHVPHVFEKFFRVPGLSRGTGTGLGLAIVQEIVTAHGGTITCESQPGTGTTFRMRLPMASGQTSQSYVFGNAHTPESMGNQER